MLISTKLSWLEFKNVLYIKDIYKGKMLQLDSISRDIFYMILEGKNCSEIISIFCSRYPIEMHLQIKNDIENFIGEMKKLEIISNRW